MHPVTHCYDGVFNARSGTKINLVDPTVDMIQIGDIIHALSQMCRFGAHTSSFYSVLQHSLLVYSLAPDELKKEALLHDAAEAYVGDVIKPLKVMLGDVYDDIESQFNQLIAQRFGLDHQKLLAVKKYDVEALIIEHGAFMKNEEESWRQMVTHFGVNCILTPAEARVQFSWIYRKHFDIQIEQTVGVSL